MNKKNKYGLTALQEAFCSAFVSNGGKKTRAAITAGYKESGARTRAYELLQRTDIQRRIFDITRSELSSMAPEALVVLQKLMVESESDTVRYQSAVSVLDRAGHKHAQVIEVQDKRTLDEIDKELELLLQPPVEQDDEAQELH